MPSWRDWVWSVLVCLLLTFVLQLRPAWAARRFIQRESQAGFYDAYAGHRFASGEVIGADGGVQVDPMASAVADRRLVIEAERTSWSGNKAEFVVRHRIELVGGGFGNDASQDVHLEIKRAGKRWVYTLFEVRGSGVLAEPNAGNPWARALRDAQPQTPAAKPAGRRG